jgi:hypothetical protein
MASAQTPFLTEIDFKGCNQYIAIEEDRGIYFGNTSKRTGVNLTIQELNVLHSLTRQSIESLQNITYLSNSKCLSISNYGGTQMAGIWDCSATGRALLEQDCGFSMTAKVFEEDLSDLIDQLKEKWFMIFNELMPMLEPGTDIQRCGITRAPRFKPVKGEAVAQRAMINAAIANTTDQK